MVPHPTRRVVLKCDDPTNRYFRQKILKLTKITIKVTKQLKSLIIALAYKKLKGKANKYSTEDKHMLDVGQAIPILLTTTKNPLATLTSGWVEEGEYVSNILVVQII